MGDELCAPVTRKGVGRWIVAWIVEARTCSGLLGAPLVLERNITRACQAAMIDRHWDGIASYGQPENTVSLGLMEGLNNTIPSSSVGPRATGTRTTSHSKSLPPSSLR
jgi:hypothetical protein